MNYDIIIATIWVFIGELYGNFVGGWSVITQIVLQNILWMDIKKAIALDNAAVIGSNLGMFLIMVRKYKIKKWFFPFIIAQWLWAILWAYTLVKIDPDILKMIFIWAVILLVIKNLFIKDTEGSKKWFKVNSKSIVLLIFAWLFIGAYNAAFVIWDWIIALLILTAFFSMKYHNAIYIMTISSLFAQSIAVRQYYVNWLLDIEFLIPMIIATFLGWMICATVLEKIHSEKLEQFLKYLSVVLVWYLIFWLVF